MARAHKDYMLTAEELRLKRRRRRTIAGLTIIVLVVLGLGVLLARPTRNAIKGWQSRRHAANAFALIEKQEWSSARDEAIAAYQLRQTEPEALRAIARLLSRTRQTQALEFWDKLSKIEPLTRGDLRDEAAIALFAGDASRAATAIKQLLEHDPQPPDLLLDAQLAAQSQSIDRARDDCEKVASDLRASSREKLQATVLEIQLLKDASKEQMDTAWGRIEKLAQGKDIVSLDALMLLAQRALASPSAVVGQARRLPPTEDAASRNARPTDLPPQDLGSLSQALECHPLARAAHKLLALDLLERASVAPRNELIERAVSQFHQGDADDVAALARWLNSKGEYQRVIDSISLEQALKGREVFLQYLDALGALGRWSDIKQLLESERFPLDAVVQRMYIARCNAQLGEKTAADNNWQRALEAAGGDPIKLMQLGTFAEKNGRLDIADGAYRDALVHIPQFRPAYDGRLRVAQASRETKKIHEVLVEMLGIWPNDTAVQNDEAYTRLLLMPTKSTANSQPSTGNSIEAADPAVVEPIEKLAEQLVHDEPKSLPHRTLLALARLRAGHINTALDAYNIEVPEEVITPSAVAVRAVALAANRRQNEATELVRNLNRDQLVPEERALIEEAESGKQ
jgi:tetratricopeptide (TPR) repeat protein